MSLPLTILNLALLKIGHSKSIIDLTEATRHAYTGNLIYTPTLKETLQAYPWPFATAYTPETGAGALLLTAGVFWDTTASTMLNVQAWSSANTYAVGEVVRQASVNYYCILAHTNQTPPNATYWSTTTAPDYANRDWSYAYREPSDSLFIRRLVRTGGTARLPSTYSEIAFKLGRDANGQVIFTNEAEAVAEYTKYVEPSATLTDSLFEDALAWKLAAKFAMSLAQDKEMAAECERMFETIVFPRSMTTHAREQQHPADGDAEWIAGR